MQKMKRMFSFSWKDLGITVLIMAIVSGICWLLKPISDTDAHVPQIFLVGVMLISLWTNGYFFGILASLIAVLGVNIVFTYPYYEMDFSLTGYPLTFLCMLAASLVTCTATTRLLETEQIERQAEQESIRANLLRAISHDFRTPLTGIIGSLTLVKQQDERLSHEERINMLEGAKSEAEWLMNMVENLLSVTRIDGESRVLHTEPQIMEEVASEAVTRFHRQYPDFPVRIRVPQIPLMAKIDAMLVEQVLLNLLLNTVMHGQTAREACIIVEEKAKQVLVSVEDDGCGMDQIKLDNFLSERMGNENSMHQDASRGMGIGLSVCQTIIKAHGGRMWGVSSPGEGCRFFFTLPKCSLDISTMENIDGE